MTRIRRGSGGPWVYCLAELPASDEGLRLLAVSQKTSEGDALEFFRKELAVEGYFLIKLQAHVASRIWVKQERAILARK